MVADDEQVCLVFRLLNNPLFPPKLAAIAWQKRNGDKYFLSCLTTLSDEEKNILTALCAKDLLAVDLSHFRQAIHLSYNGVVAKDVVLRAEMRKGREKSIPHMAARQRRRFCLATRHRMVEKETDLDECYRHHMGWELDLLAKFQP